MKKKVLFIFALALFFITMFPLSAQTNETAVENAYQCLENQIGNQTCESLSTSEKVFSLLSVNDCRAELLNDSSTDNECWPSGNCNLKTTSQAVLALGTSSVTDNAKDWLTAQNTTTSNIDWFLQIDSDDVSTCEISYASNTYNVSIDSDKKLSSPDTGSCLSITSSGYWLEISNTCYNNEFEISCNEGFVTNLLFQKEDSSTIQVLDDTHGASADGSTKEKVESFCFMNSQGTCDYEGSLWSALALDSLGEDIQPYVPYLITFSEENDNEQFLPEAFLFHLTGLNEFRTELLSKQISGYWDVSGDQYYDTALALYPFSNEALNERTETEEALLEDQEENGCWDSGNILNTAFILYSVWPEFAPSPGGGGSGGEDCSDDSQCVNPGYVCSSEGECVLEDTNQTEELDCVDEGYSCLSTRNCFGLDGDILDDYSCNIGICCSETPVSETCSDLGGNICTSGQTCNGIEIPASGINVCCDGTCVEGSSGGTGLDCETYNGVCEPSQCGDGYTQNSEYSCDFGDICCFLDDDSGGDSNAVIWLIALGILVLLVILGIVFRDKLKTLWLKIKSGKGSSRNVKRGPGGFPPLPPPSRNHPRRPMPRRILPSHPPQRKPTRRPKSSSELDEVLKKLKRIGK